MASVTDHIHSFNLFSGEITKKLNIYSIKKRGGGGGGAILSYLYFVKINSFVCLFIPKAVALNLCSPFKIITNKDAETTALIYLIKIPAVLQSIMKFKTLWCWMRCSHKENT